jgi:hypothetical protein
MIMIMITIVIMVVTVIVIAMVVAVMIVMLRFGILTLVMLAFGILTLLTLAFGILTLLTLAFSILTLLTLVLSIPSRSIAGVIFCRSHKIHGSIARVIFVAVRPPILRVPRRHMQIYRLDADSSLRLLDDNRLRVDQLRWRRPVGQIHPAVNTGRDLPRYRQANIHVAGSCQRRRQAERSGEQRYGTNYSGHHSSSRYRRLYAIGDYASPHSKWVDREGQTVKEIALRTGLS